MCTRFKTGGIICYKYFLQRMLIYLDFYDIALHVSVICFIIFVLFILIPVGPHYTNMNFFLV